MTVAPLDGVGLAQRVECRLFGCLRDGVEDEVERRPLCPELALHEDLDSQDSVRCLTRNTVGRREREKDLPGPVVADTAGTTESDVDSSRESSQLSGMQRQLRRHDGDARS